MTDLANITINFINIDKIGSLPVNEATIIYYNYTCTYVACPSH